MGAAMTMTFSGSRRDSSGMIGRILQSSVGREVPYVLDVDVEHGRLGVRVFASLTAAEQMTAAAMMRDCTPVHLVIDLVCEPTRFDLRSMAEAIAMGEPGAVEVFVDAVLELGIASPERYGPAFVGRVLAWAEEVFPTVRAPTEGQLVIGVDPGDGVSRGAAVVAHRGSDGVVTILGTRTWSRD